jgi:cytochrome c
MIVIRNLVSAAGLAVMMTAAQAQGDAAVQARALAEKNFCLACHKLDERLVGPSYKEVAAKYRGDPGASDRLVAKVKKGGKGVWGKDAMPPNKDMSDEDIKTIVGWVLAQ